MTEALNLEKLAGIARNPVKMREKTSELLGVGEIGVIDNYRLDRLTKLLAVNSSIYDRADDSYEREAIQWVFDEIDLRKFR